MQKYCDFFQTLHDERSPTGHLGRGTHYSVMRAIVFHDATGLVLTEGKLCDFAVIWDEDHDERVIEPIEYIYRRGLLASFLFFGERKGGFSAVLTDEVLSQERKLSLSTQIEKITQNLNDPWASYVTGIADNSIISDSADKVGLYLANLRMLWGLGLKTVSGSPIQIRYRYSVALQAYEDYLRQHSGKFVRNGPAMLTPEETAEREQRIEELASAIKSLALDGRATYARFEAIRAELQKLGMIAPQNLVSDVTQAFLSG